MSRPERQPCIGLLLDVAPHLGLEGDKDPAMPGAEKKVIDAQKKKIAEFDRWLAA